MSNFNINNFDDPAVWDLICEGDTKGVFQLESNLGKKWARESQPRNIKELAALISLIRPGTLLAKHKSGKNMTEVYCLRKSGAPDFPVEYDHESLEPILKETYGVLVYQEQSMQIAQKLAGFDLKEADALRKAIGKKKADLMEQVKKSFLRGAASKGIVTNKVAEEIFANIEKSNRYAFNKSHAVAYAINAYWAAYCKHHRRKKFYQTWLDGSEGKPKPEIERKQLIMDARKSDIDVWPPRLNNLHTNFTRDPKKDIIHYGLRYIKFVGTAECQKIESLEKDIIKDYNWMDCLVNIIHELKLNKRSAIALISVGAFLGKNNRNCTQKMLYEFDSWKQLSAREQQAIADNHNNGDKCSSLSDAVKKMTQTIKVNSRRMTTIDDIIESLDNPFYNTEDTPSQIAKQETKYLSCSLTSSVVKNLSNLSLNMCKDIANGVITGKVNIAVEVAVVKIIRTKKGDWMAFLTVEDISGSSDSIVVFPEAWESYKDLLIEGNTVLITGNIQSKDKTSVIVDKIKQI